MPYYAILRQIGVGILRVKKVPNRFMAVALMVKHTTDERRVDMIAGDRWDEYLAMYPGLKELVGE